MSEEKVEAKMEELGGNVKEAVGKVTGDKEVETEGQVDQLKGKVKSAAADFKDTVSGAIKGITK
jgi:uncharacterized protein YjbJ (UPF0337 family)